MAQRRSSLHLTPLFTSLHSTPSRSLHSYDLPSSLTPPSSPISQSYLTHIHTRHPLQPTPIQYHRLRISTDPQHYTTPSSLLLHHTNRITPLHTNANPISTPTQSTTQHNPHIHTPSSATPPHTIHTYTRTLSLIHARKELPVWGTRYTLLYHSSFPILLSNSFFSTSRHA